MSKKLKYEKKKILKKIKYEKNGGKDGKVLQKFMNNAVYGKW